MKLYRIFLPKQYNDGREIEAKKIGKLTELIRERFGAYSINPFATLPVIQGVWTSEERSRLYIEPMFMIELFIEDTFDNQKWLKSFKEMARQELEQVELFVIAQNAEILRD